MHLTSINYAPVSLYHGLPLNSMHPLQSVSLTCYDVSCFPVRQVDTLSNPFDALILTDDSA